MDEQLSCQILDTRLCPPKAQICMNKKKQKKEKHITDFWWTTQDGQYNKDTFKESNEIATSIIQLKKHTCHIWYISTWHETSAHLDKSILSTVSEVLKLVKEVSARSKQTLLPPPKEKKV